MTKEHNNWCHLLEEVIEKQRIIMIERMIEIDRFRCNLNCSEIVSLNRIFLDRSTGH